MTRPLCKATTLTINGEPWMTADEEETSALFCLRMGWREGDVLECLSGFHGKRSDGSFVLLTHLYRITKIGEPCAEAPHYGCDVKMDCLNKNGKVSYHGGRNMVLPGFRWENPIGFGGELSYTVTCWPWRLVRKAKVPT